MKSSLRVAEYLETIKALAPVIESHRNSFDQERRLPDCIFNMLADAGLFRLWLPEALGGPQLSPFEFMTVVEAAAALDGSVGWSVGNGGGMGRAGAFVPEATARKWFAQSRTFIVASTGAVGEAYRVGGGFRVSGPWPFGSGAHHATHFMANALMTNGHTLLSFYMVRQAVT